MIRFLGIFTAVLAVAVVAHADEPKKAERKISVAFGTPTPGYKVTITEVRAVGDELWARVDVVPPKGIVIQVLGKASAEATIPAAEGKVKFLIFGKGNVFSEDKSIVLMSGLPEADREKIEKDYAAGKLVFPVEKK